MRIMMLSQFYPPLLGGEERHVQDLSVELAARGHEVAVVTLSGDGLAPFELDRGVRVYRVGGLVQRAGWLFQNPSKRQAPPFPDPQVVWALRRIIARERPAVVHAHNWLVHSFLPLKAWSGARLVMSLHDYSFICAKKKLIHRGAPCDGPGPAKCAGCAAGHYGALKGLPTLLANWASGIGERAAVDLFLPVSQATAAENRLPGSGLPFQVLPNFIPDDLGAPTAAAHPDLARLPGAGYLLFVGALGRHKGIDVLLRAYAGLADPPPLVLIGYETAEYPLGDAELPPNVIVLKNWPRDAIMEAWRRSAVALVPSTCKETFGIVVLEAMAAGRPVIASRIGGLPEVVADGETGLLAPPGDAEALRQAIRLLLNNQDLRERLGQAGLRRVAQFRAGAVVPRFEHAYQRVADKVTR